MNPDTRPKKPPASSSTQKNNVAGKTWRKPQLIELDLDKTESGPFVTAAENTISFS